MSTELQLDKSDWKPVTFGDVVSEVRKSTKDPVVDGIERVVGLEHIEPECIHLRNWASINEETTFTKTFEKGHVLFGRRRAYLKKAAQAEFRGICSGDITVMEAKEELLPELLPFLVCNDKFFDYAVQHSAGGLSPRTKFKDLANYEFLLPPKDQQAKLAKLLWATDHMTQSQLSCDGARDTLEKVILKSLFTVSWKKEGFFKDLDPNQFSTRRLQEVCTESLFGPRFSSKLYSEDGEIASLRTTDIDKVGNISYSTIPRADIPVDKFSDHFLQEGDLLISRSGTCGLTAVFGSHEVPVVPGAFLIRFRLTDEANPFYLKTFFNSEFGKNLTEQLASGAVQKNLTSKALLNVNVPLPPRKIQDGIIASLEEIRCDALKDASTALEQLQKSLINQIF